MHLHACLFFSDNLVSHLAGDAVVPAIHSHMRNPKLPYRILEQGITTETCLGDARLHFTPKGLGLID